MPSKRVQSVPNKNKNRRQQPEVTKKHAIDEVRMSETFPSKEVEALPYEEGQQYIQTSGADQTERQITHSAPVPPPDLMVFENVEGLVNRTFQGVASYLSKDLTPPELAQALSALKTWDKDLTDLHDNARDRVENLLLTNGTSTTDKGSRELVVDGFILSMRPMKSGLNPKKVEALLRAKNLPVEQYMDAEVKYILNEQKTMMAVQNGALTTDELETCKHELSYAVQAPKRVGDSEVA